MRRKDKNLSGWNPLSLINWWRQLITWHDRAKEKKNKKKTKYWHLLPSLVSFIINSKISLLFIVLLLFCTEKLSGFGLGTFCFCKKKIVLILRMSFLYSYFFSWASEVGLHWWFIKWVACSVVWKLEIWKCEF